MIKSLMRIIAEGQSSKQSVFFDPWKFEYYICQYMMSIELERGSYVYTFGTTMNGSSMDVSQGGDA